MKVLVGLFTCESNANIPLKNEITQFVLGFGEDVAKNARVADVFANENIDIIPSIYASAGASGVIKKDCFEYIESCFVKACKEHKDEIDGVWLHLHGASYVEEYGSGDHHILKTIREILGPYIPIAIVCDPHGNLTKEYVENCTIIRSYRESPHTDADATKKLVAKMLCDHLKNRQNIHSIYRKLPLILGGEQSVSTDEPVLSINKYMDEMEKDPRVLSCSWHVGYIRHDCPEAGCGIVVVPATEYDIEYCEKRADELAKYVWDKRHEFHYTGHSAYPDIALKEALAFDGKPVFITDSGDNTTAGSLGHNTYILRQFLNVEDLSKKVLIANITDRNAYNLLANYQVNDIVNIDLGMNTDENSVSVYMNVRIISFGKMMGNKWSGENRVWGNVVLVNVIDKNIDVVISTCNNSMTQINQFTKANVNIDDYDIIVVKQGYLFPELKNIAAFSVMSLTKGYTIQDTRSIDYKLICRPMYPIDNI